ncbi:hypothetical protein BJP34_10395 [Moorena producens PAL-8-15-08-1]|uniref:Uncharacterized protein n=1 Tax=Moorena producens PAL-8-15-08-1 TaxID=1458985 RepID=A0A1D8TQ88_9CYAN|nr:hypothetical protein BJP34_10395 [Moorena producens PAL-8-15-08-1]
MTPPLKKGLKHLYWEFYKTLPMRYLRTDQFRSYHPIIKKVDSIVKESQTTKKPLSCKHMRYAHAA